MIGICGYNLCHDINALNPMPTNLVNLTNTKIENGIYDEVSITKDVAYEYTTTIPNFDNNTILQCKFENSLGAGNTGLTMNQINGLRLKRRKVGTSDWVKVSEDIPIISYEDLTVTIKDRYCASLQEYEWAFIPMLDGVEGNYIVSTLTTNFNGIFICDSNTMFKLYEGVSYGSMAINKQIGTLLPIGSKYPIIVSNADTIYKSGSVSGLVFQENFSDTRKIDRSKIVERTQEISDFFNNGEPKIIKDWNGNVWLVVIINSSVDYVANEGMGIVSVTGNWVEQGDPNIESELSENGLV